MARLARGRGRLFWEHSGLASECMCVAYHLFISSTVILGCGIVMLLTLCCQTFYSILRTICISKVGDTSIDLPEANVIIQVSSHFGSRRQEAQRLGRILRPKSYTQTDGSNRSSFNAFFYTLVSTDTQEMFYSAKRQQYLIDQGYTFKIVTTLSERADREAIEHDYAYKNSEDDRKLLRTVLTSDTELEKDQKAEDNAIKKGDEDLATFAAKRGNSMANLSGGSGARYSSGPRKVHPMFAKRKKR